MADTYELILMIKKNGLPLQELTPINKRLTVVESHNVSFTRTSGGGPVALPIAQIGDVSLLLFQGNQLQTLSLGDITCQPGAVVLLFNATPSTETLTNASGEESLNTTLAGGS